MRVGYYYTIYAPIICINSPNKQMLLNLRQAKELLELLSKEITDIERKEKEN